MKRSFFALCALLFALPCLAADPPPPRPKLKLAADNFPTGHVTPEAAACDLARAFITNDAALFTTTCLPAYGDQPSQDTYKEFLHGVVTGLLKIKSLKLDPDPTGPKSIARLYAARHLSHAEPALYARATFGFQDVMFVDVDGLLNNGDHALNRTLVIRARDGQWYAHPAPEIAPLLSDGLDDESLSTREFTDAYDLER